MAPRPPRQQQQQQQGPPRQQAGGQQPYWAPVRHPKNETPAADYNPDAADRFADQLLGHRVDEYVDPRAKLVSNPRHLLTVWHEYIHGVQGNKPAKNFTQQERGRHKSKYCRRLAFWEVMTKLVNSGYSETTAIDHIRRCYGESLSVTKILQALATDRRKGSYHANLGVQPRSVRGARLANRGL
jgi:hypothetical protein